MPVDINIPCQNKNKTELAISQYKVVMFPPNAAAFKPGESGKKPLLEEVVQIANFYAHGPRARRYGPHVEIPLTDDGIGIIDWFMMPA